MSSLSSFKQRTHGDSPANSTRHKIQIDCQLTRVMEMMTHGFQVSSSPLLAACILTVLEPKNVGVSSTRVDSVLWRCGGVEGTNVGKRNEIVRRNGDSNHLPRHYPSGKSSQCLRNPPAGPARHQSSSYTAVVPLDTPADKARVGWR